jgi:hypothetical protein
MVSDEDHSFAKLQKEGNLTLITFTLGISLASIKSLKNSGLVYVPAENNVSRELLWSRLYARVLIFLCFYQLIFISYEVKSVN